MIVIGASSMEDLGLAFGAEAGLLLGCLSAKPIFSLHPELDHLPRINTPFYPCKQQRLASWSMYSLRPSQ